jgi:hypothetical protein
MFIKIFDPLKAKELEALGYQYMLEKINGKDVYVFENVPQLNKLLQTSFSKKDFFIDNLICF